MFVFVARETELNRSKRKIWCDEKKKTYADRTLYLCIVYLTIDLLSKFTRGPGATAPALRLHYMTEVEQ